MNKESSEIVSTPETQENIAAAVPETPEQSPPLYPEPYFSQDGCLWYLQMTKNGEVPHKLCNFLPRIVKEKTYDDGIRISKILSIGGTDEYGSELSPVDVPIDELVTMNWMENRWDTRCCISVVNSAEKHLRNAIKATAGAAEHEYVFAHTGWKKIGGKWEYLLPGNAQYGVCLKDKLKSYMATDSCSDGDLAVLAEFLRQNFVPYEVMYPCLAFVFLTPMNEFLKQAEQEPKFMLALTGHTGTRKSTLAALMLSFFGKFTATDLPMSFHDTANSIIYTAGLLKDVLTCIDDYHPTARHDSAQMSQVMHGLRHTYAQNTEKRLKSEGRRNVDKTVSENLGHHRLEITKIYKGEK